jgi:hypothetical protein
MITREERAARYNGRRFASPDGSDIFTCYKETPGSVIHTVNKHWLGGLTNPDELDLMLLDGTIVEWKDGG